MQAGGDAGAQPQQRLFQAARGLGGRRIDELHLNYPFAGSRMLCGLLRGEGIAIGRQHVGTLMRRMGIEALYRRPRTTKPATRPQNLPLSPARPGDYAAEPGLGDGHHLYILMARGIVYLAVVLDWFSRRALSWRVSITLEDDFCVGALEEALSKHGKPEIVNTDQGSQFTGAAFTGVLARRGIAISMDGKGAWRDNVFRSASGAASNMRRCICGPMAACARPKLASAAQSPAPAFEP